MDCTCECDPCRDDDCENCDHEGCDADEENCVDCPMAARGVKVETTREMPPLVLRAEVAPNSLDEAKRTVDVVWSTGARVLRGFWEQYYEELDMSPSAVRMGRLQSGAAPVLNAHQSYDLSDVIGVVESARLEGGKGLATVRFARDAESDLIFSKVRDGILRNLSIGYRNYRMEKVADGEGQIPVMRVVDWEPYEVSFVPVGADADAIVRAERSRAAAGAPNPCIVVEERKMANATAPKDAPNATEPAKPAVTEETRAAVKAEERERVLAIQRTARTLKCDEKLAAEHVEQGTTVAAFRELAERDYEERQRKMAPISSHQPNPSGSIVAGEDAADKFKRGVSNWLFHRAGVAEKIAQDNKRRGVTMDLDPGEFRGKTLVDLAALSLELKGVRAAGMDRMRMVAMALTHRGIAGLASSSDFPVILENVLYKTLLAAYGITPDTWTRFCITGSVSDFRPNKRYRLGSFGGLAALNEHGEFQRQQIPDAYREQISAATKGNIIGITRQAIINDDMDAFARLPAMLGRAAKLSIEQDVYALLALNAGLGPTMTDGNTLFHASHNNITTGAALSVTALDADRVALKSQRDPSGNEILDLVPSVMVVPAGLGGQARVINGSQYDVDASGPFATAKSLVPNRAVGLFNEIVDTARISGTRRYIFADPAVIPCLEVAFLDGVKEPFMEMKNGWDVDGVEWKVRLDYAVGAIEWRSAITNAGA